jgi:predicted HTH transcriptional regulator
MTLFELNEIIEKGENLNTEFKRRFTECDKIAKEMIAFANTKGGVILFGVDDDRSVVGVESEKGEIEYIELASRYYCEPEINCKIDVMHIYKKDVVVVEIPESSNKPHRLIENGKSDREIKVYIRVNDKSVLACKEMVKVLQKSRPDSPPLVINLGEKERALMDYLRRHETVTASEVRSLLNISGRRTSRMLVNLLRAGLIQIHYSGSEYYYTLNL